MMNAMAMPMMNNQMMPMNPMMMNPMMNMGMGMNPMMMNPMMMGMGMPMMMPMMGMGMGGAPGKPPKPPRHTSPATGESVRLELHREGNNIRYEVLDGKTGKPRYLGQAPFMQAMDVAAVKLFVTNRNGVEPVDVVLKDLTIRADHINGLGTTLQAMIDGTQIGQVFVGDQAYPVRILSTTQPVKQPAESGFPGRGTRAAGPICQCSRSVEVAWPQWIR